MDTNVGIDVSKAHPRVVRGPGRVDPAHAERAATPLPRWCTPVCGSLDPERIVVESTGGYERKLVLKLAEAGSRWSS